MEGGFAGDDQGDGAFVAGHGTHWIWRWDRNRIVDAHDPET
jgi:hypothetical protein